MKFNWSQSHVYGTTDNLQFVDGIYWKVLGMNITTEALQRVLHPTPRRTKTDLKTEKKFHSFCFLLSSCALTCALTEYIRPGLTPLLSAVGDDGPLNHL